MESKRLNPKFLGWAISFWIGVGLMSIINFWKLSGGRNPILYDQIMFGVSLVLIVVCFVILFVRKKR